MAPGSYAPAAGGSNGAGPGTATLFPRPVASNHNPPSPNEEDPSTKFTGTEIKIPAPIRLEDEDSSVEGNEGPGISMDQDQPNETRCSHSAPVTSGTPTSGSNEVSDSSTGGRQNQENVSTNSKKGTNSLDYESDGMDVDSNVDYEGRMQRMEDEIFEDQEHHLLQRLDMDLNQAVEISKALPPNSLIECISVKGEKGHWPTNFPPSICSKSTNSNTRRNNSTSADSSKKSVVAGIKRSRIREQMRSLPKFYLGKDIIFTRAEFFTGVIHPVVQELKQSGPHLQWKVDLIEHPNSYTLVYRGPKELLDAIARRTEDWIKYRLTHCRLCHLVEDPESLLVDVTLGSGESLGGQMGTPFSEIDLPPKQRLVQEGVWFTLTDKTMGLSLRIGHRALEAGCAILNINNFPINSNDDLRKILSRIKDEGHSLNITLCISKYADLTQIQRVVHRLRRVDGRKFDPSYYRDFHVLWKAQHQKKKQNKSVKEKTSWIAYPKRPVAIPRNYPSKAPTTGPTCLKLAAQIISSSRRVEVDIFLSASQPLGFEIVEDRKSHQQGLWCRKVKKSGQLGQILGPKACRIGCVLWKASGEKLYSESDLDRVKYNVRLFDGTFRATFLFLYGTDFSGLNTNKLVQGAANPRQRNGTPYPIHLQPAPGYREPVRDGLSKRKLDDGGTTGRVSKKRKPTTGSSIDHKKSFASFRDKYKDAVMIEYRKTPIKSVRAISYMWERHKAYLGEDRFCDDNCPCVHKLGKLSKYVIADFIEDQAINGIEIRKSEVKEVGFLTRFRRKFMPKLKKEYPDETLKQLLDRLVKMWPLHEKQRIYGIVCREDCECGDSWELLFGRGDPSKGEYHNRSKAKKAIRPATSIPTTAAPNQMTIPRKKKAANKKTPNLAQYISPSLLAAGSKTTNSDPSKSEVQVDGYQIEFDPSAPLGMFVRDQDGQCIVRSVDPHGQAITRDKYKRVQKGTIIQSILVGTESIHIKDLQTLKQHYDILRGEKKPFTMVLSNLAVNQIRGNLMNGPDVKDEWSLTGAWKGGQLRGWAGGAIDTKGQPVDKNSRGASTTLQEKSNKHDLSIVSDRWDVVYSTVEPKHQKAAKPMSILGKKSKKSKRSSGSKIIVIAEQNNESRDFDPSSSAAERLIRVSEISSGRADHVQEQLMSPRDQLIDAVGKKGCIDLIHLLQRGAAADPRVTSSTLQELNVAARKLLESATEQLSCKPNDPNLQAKVLDFQAKRAVLKIYIASAHWISCAMSLQSWQWLEVKVSEVEMFLRDCKDVQGRSHVLRGIARTLVGGRQHEGILGELPERMLAPPINYEDPLPTFLASNNIYFEKEVRSFSLELLEGSARDSLPPKKLGVVLFPLNEVDEKCPASGEEKEVRYRMRPTEAVREGDATFLIRKRRVSPEWINQRRMEAEEKILEQIESVERFNQDYNTEVHGQLTGHIQGTGGVTLLHAAINLQRDDHVERLVSLGVNPRERSDMGTGLGFAVKLREVVSEKVQARRRQENPNAEAIAKSEQLFGKYERIVKLLRTAIDAVADSDDPITAEVDASFFDKASTELSTRIEGATETQSSTLLDGEEKEVHKNAGKDNTEFEESIVLQEALENIGPAPGYSAGEAILESDLRDWLDRFFENAEKTNRFIEQLIESELVVFKETTSGAIFLIADLSI